MKMKKKKQKIYLLYGPRDVARLLGFFCMVRRPSRISCLIARSLLKSSQVRVEKKKKRYLGLVFSILVMVCVRHQSSCNFVVVFRTRSLILVESEKRKKRKTQGLETQMHLEPLEPISTTSN